MRIASILGLLAAVVENRRGATAIEYGLIATLIFLVIVGAVNLFANDVTELFNTVSNNVTGNT